MIKAKKPENQIVDVHGSECTKGTLHEIWSGTYVIELTLLYENHSKTFFRNNLGHFATAFGSKIGDNKKVP